MCLGSNRQNGGDRGDVWAAIAKMAIIEEMFGDLLSFPE